MSLAFLTIIAFNGTTEEPVVPSEEYTGDDTTYTGDDTSYTDWGVGYGGGEE